MSGGNYECGGSAPKCCIELDPVTLTNDNSLVNNYMVCKLPHFVHCLNENK